MRVMENLKNKNSEIKTNVEVPQGKTTSSHHKVLKHSFFAFVCLLLLGILLLVVGSYTTNVSEI